MKPKNKLLNRVFAIIFALIILTWMYYLVTSWDPGVVRKELIAPEISFLIIVIGLLIEAWKPSLDFTFHRNRKWIFASIILFTVFVLINAYWWIVHGLVNWLPHYGWPKTLIEWLMGTFAMETSSLSLLFGILFLTKSVPQKSLSYKLILIGALIFNALLFPRYIQWAFISGYQGSQYYANFFGYTIFQPWFWLDLTSEIVITIGAVWLLVKGKKD
ncbi:MAG: hypothetical protein Q8O03_06955 [Nanoarchaeota archaeon]|nr:hypothetical protein [Nanoarchaeota archaeon]